FTNLLCAITADERAPIGQLPILGEAELHSLTRGWNIAPESRLGIPAVHTLFEAQASATPDAIALVHDDRELSYAELNARANRVAHRLIAEGVAPDARVGICTERSVEMIVSLLGVLKAGAAYVPLDPAYPPERLAYMAEDAGIRLVLSASSIAHGAGLAGAGRRILDVGSAPPAGPEHNPGVPVSLHNLAYVMYTSGSTGKPKGVGITHDALARHSQVGCEFFGLAAGERMLQFSTFNFDGFVEQLYPALSCGATVILRGPDLWDSEELYRRLLRHRITVADFTTAYWFQFVQDWAARGYTDYGVLRQVNVGGEAMPPEGLAAWRAAGLSHVRLLNTYGPTEAAVTAMIHDCDGYVSGRLPKPAQMPIGHALPGRAIYLLDGEMNPVAIGAAGELCIGGELLARGYHGRSGLTAERFIPDPFGAPGARLYRSGDLARWKADGVIEYLGRIDHQVKLRGFRIELGEIESQLAQHASVKDCVVVARTSAAGEKSLVAYFTARGAQRESIDTLRAWMKERLPEHMVPAAFVEIEHLPLTPSGKVNRRALP
ncbi:MAG TPA: amino acid adenylation domain-containing protein, partial [Ramlibacter sp.]